ncbi:MAG TPA: rhodanese-like domain-containing protein [Pyrinomonadaceae bacterium]|jgi:3-mercaptopyruvate sulfurtransferase SseA|nr:rhodanese-like domain-containing protein [Pyrinomonadaceae bacterium]
MRTLIHTSAALLFALLSLAVGAAAQHSNGRTLFVSAMWQTTPVAQETAPGDGVRRITPTEVSAALAKGEAVIVDVRGDSSYEAGHIKGAIHMPTDQLLSRVGELPRDKMIITYCS